MKKFIICLMSIIFCIFIFSACKDEEYEPKEYIIVNKYSERKMEVFESWLLDKHIYKDYYYFILKNDEKQFEISVSGEDYHSYETNDIYLY